MTASFTPLKKAMQIFGATPETLHARGISENSLPNFARSEADRRTLKSWSGNELPAVGQQIGFLESLAEPLAVAVFVTKGGVLKSSLTLNLARMAALHGIRTCVVGLDMQGDVSTALSEEAPLDDSATLNDAVERMNQLRGLPDVFAGDRNLQSVICETDLPTLFYIPETPELVTLDQSLVNRNRREYWLRDHVIVPLKKDFDLILMDCSPNWNRLITNALVACDVLMAPLECKINNFRNFKTFHALISEFQTDMAAEFKRVFVPTRLSANRKLSREIFEWYGKTLGDECTANPIRESIQGEEAMALRLSIPEHAPTCAAAIEMRALLRELWSRWQKNESASISSTTRRENRSSRPSQNEING